MISQRCTNEALLIIDNNERFYKACTFGSVGSVITRLIDMFDKQQHKPEWFDFRKADAKQLEKRIKEIQKEVRS